MRKVRDIKANYDVQQLIELVNKDIPLRKIASEMGVSAQTIRMRMLKIDAQFPGVFGNRTMKHSIVTPEQESKVWDMLQKGHKLEDIRQETGISSAKICLVSCQLKAKNGIVSVVDKSLISDIEDAPKFEKRQKDYSEKLPEGITSEEIFTLCQSRKMTRGEISDKYNIGQHIIRKIYQEEHKKRFPGNKGEKAKFDIDSFIKDVNNDKTWEFISKKYNISIMNACQWGKKLRLKYPEKFTRLTQIRGRRK